jgi:hypothetical protein
MIPFSYLNPQILNALSEAIITSPSSKHGSLEQWISTEISNDRDRIQLRFLLRSLGAIENYQYCGKWFKDLSLGFDEEIPVAQDDTGDFVYQNGIMLTKAGEAFIKKLLSNYIKTKTL